MNSLYLMFIPKSRRINVNRSGSSLLFPMPSIIIRLLNSSNWQNNLLVSPGYLSRTASTTKWFYDAFDSLAPAKYKKDCRKPMLGFLRGMHGEAYFTSLVDLQMNEMRKHAHCFTPGLCLDFTGTDKDHRKMVFFYSINDDSDSFDHEQAVLITPSNREAFLNSITVNAVCIGSTNFSKTSYFGGANGNFDKGEADIVLMAPSPEKASTDFYDIVGAFSADDLPSGIRDDDSERAEVYSQIREEFFYAAFAKATYDGSFKNPHGYLKNLLELTISDQLT